MIEIRNEELWGRIVAEEIAEIHFNRSLTSWEQLRYVNALAKATARVERDGCFMDFDRPADKLLIWSNSNEIYAVKADKTCQCKAFHNGHVCWHRAAKHLVSRYLLIETINNRISQTAQVGVV